MSEIEKLKNEGNGKEDNGNRQKIKRHREKGKQIERGREQKIQFRDTMRMENNVT